MLNSKENVVPDLDPKICLLIRQNDQDPANAGLFSHDIKLTSVFRHGDNSD